jgi:hypothetical protein
MLFWTGDNSPHDTYANTEQQVIDYTLHVTTMLKDTFKGTTTQIFPTTGNHDTWPVNIMSFDKPGQNVPINAYKDAWLDWIGEEASEKMGEFGYFVMDLNGTDGKPIVPGAKLISLNT